MQVREAEGRNSKEVRRLGCKTFGGTLGAVWNSQTWFGRNWDNFCVGGKLGPPHVGAAVGPSACRYFVVGTYRLTVRLTELHRGPQVLCCHWSTFGGIGGLPLTGLEWLNIRAGNIVQ